MVKIPADTCGETSAGTQSGSGSSGLRFNSIKAKLIFLVFVSILPALVIILCLGIERRNEAIRDAEKDILKASAGISFEHERTIESTRQLLIALSKVREVRDLNLRACNSLLAELLEENPVYANLFLTDARGIMVASAVPFSRRDLGHRKFFRDVVRTKALSVGEYVMGLVTRKPVLQFAYPVLDSRGELRAVLVAAIDLTRYGSLFLASGMPRGSMMTMVDHRGVCLARMPEPERFIGKTENVEVMQRMTEGEKEGTFSHTGSAGEKQLAAYRRFTLKNSSQPYLFLRVSVSQRQALAETRKVIWVSMGSLGAAFIVALLLAIMIGNATISGRLNRLVSAARRLAEGNLGARTGLRHDGDELGRLAYVFDEMADVLEKKESEQRRSREEISRLKDFHETISESIVNGVWVSDRDDRIVYLNAGMSVITGVPRESIIGLNLFEGFSEDTVGEFLKYYRQGRESLLPVSYHAIPVVTPAGRFTYQSGRLIPRTKDGVFDGMICTVDDITSQKKAEEELSGQVHFLQILIDTIPNPVFYKDTAGLYQGCNRAFEHFVGLAKEDIVGKTVFQVHPGGIASKYYNMDVELFLQPGAQTYETVLQRTTGEKRDIIISKATYNDTEGRLSGLIGVMVDITERNQAERALRESEVFLSQGEQIARLGGWKANPETDFLAWTEGVYRILGLPRDYRPGLTEGLQFYGVQYIPVIRECVARALTDATPFSVEAEVTTALGEKLWGEVRGLGRMEGEQGAFVVGTFQDITDRKKMESNLLNSLKEKELLLREVHHRVKNNMQVISSLLNMQSKHLTDTRAIDIFTTSMNRIKTMALIHDRLYRSESFTGIDLPGYVNDLASNILATYAVNKQIELSIDVVPLTLDIDMVMPLGLVINELLSNALKHGFPGEGGGKIAIRIVTEDSRMILVVSDTGVGFPEELDFMDTPSMGMQLVVTLVEQLEGTIELARGEGTEFRIAFQTA